MKQSLSKYKWGILAGPLAIAILFLVLPKTRSSRETEAHTVRKQRILERWRSFELTPIEVSPSFEQALETAILETSGFQAISKARQAPLKQLFTALVFAYHDGTFDSFERFRIPIRQSGLHYNEVEINRMAATLPGSREAFLEFHRNGKTEDSFFDLSSPKALVETYWRQIVNPSVYEDGRPAYCADCWQSISLESLQITPQTVLKNPESMTAMVATNAVMGGQTPPPILSYNPPLEQEILDYGDAQIATLSMIVGTTHQSDPYPIYLRAYWSQAHKRWLPTELSAGVNPAAIKYVF